jgi:hypothetical protein
MHYYYYVYRLEQDLFKARTTQLLPITYIILRLFRRAFLFISSSRHHARLYPPRKPQATSAAPLLLLEYFLLIAHKNCVNARY